MSTPVAITSFAARTPFGDLRQTWDRILRGHCIDDHARLNDVGLKRRAVNLARQVADAAITRLGETLDPDAAIIVGTSKGSIEDWLDRPAVNATSDNQTGGLSRSGLGEIAADLSAHYGGRGPVLTLSAACASSLHALIRGAMMIRAGEVRQALIVGVEASVHPLFLGSFQRFGILAEPGAGCRPFDENRSGFYMSEAGCAVVLEAIEPDELPGSLAVERCALGGDATHVTANDPDARLLRRLLADVIDNRPVDLVHAHGTGTESNDAVELAAIDASVSDSSPAAAIYSHKGALGHSLGASGLLSIVLNCMCHEHGVIPPNARTTNPLPARHVTISNSPINRPVRGSLAIAAGFGGPTAVVSLASR